MTDADGQTGGRSQSVTGNPARERVDTELKDRLRKYAESQERDVPWVIRKMIEENLNRHEKGDPMAKILIGKYEATIYPEGDGCTGAISLGFGPDGKRQRLKRKGKTKTVVKDKLIKAVKDLEAGVTASETYTVRDAVNDWLNKGLKGRSRTPSPSCASSPRRTSSLAWERSSSSSYVQTTWMSGLTGSPAGWPPPPCGRSTVY
jgi:hypothetical protein